MLKLSSPAKVNLFLKVVRRRDDGFHDIVSLFQTISLEDRLTFSFSEKDKVSCSDPSIPTDGRNLVNKARDLFRKKTGTDATFDIAIEKNIPAEAGLGGGSSNAATTLWALNTLAGNPATHDELREWASELGSDVAFFLSHGTALCTGRGEKIKELPPLP
ncbi:MAG: 4-(cytidine 5'-diphospho)-2-C-methyl-D-erythritol kinase, partial [Waddliaceae bacterium]|nr:4-(cytidine 5'-diphospho)-2-C-methyl-D-erythritol kinase [Waddliaceae bacterium]